MAWLFNAVCSKRTFRLSLLLSMTMFVTACNDSSSDSAPPEIDPVIVTVSGSATAGPIAGGTVNIFAVGADGLKTGDPIATATTDDAGNYTADLTDFTGVYIVEITGGSYVDEATGTVKTVPADAPLRAVSSIAEGGDSTVSTVVTPLTEIAVQVAAQKEGGLTSDNVTASNNEVGALFFGDSADAGAKLLSTRPAVITDEVSATASADEITMGLLVSAISQLEASGGSLADIANDIAADGNLETTAADLTAATETVLASDTNISGIDSATKINNILTAAVTGVDTVIAASSDAVITRFTFADALSSSVDGTTSSVSVLMPFGTDLATLADAVIGVSLGATVAAENGENFSAPVSYVVTAEDNSTRAWTVTVTVAATEASPLANITGESSDLLSGALVNVSGKTVNVSVAALSDLTTLDAVSDVSSLFTVSDGASIAAAGGSFASGTVSYVVTAADGTTTATWTVRVRISTPQDQPTLSIGADQTVAVNAAPITLQVTGGIAESALSFTSSDTAVATVGADGVVSIVAAGSTTLTATKAAVSTSLADYLATSASIVLTVNKIEQATLAFSAASVSSALSAGTVTNALTGGSGTGAVTYSSSDTAIATVNDAGAVTLVAAGTATISAVKAGDATFLDSATASFALTVTADSTTPANTDCVLGQSALGDCTLQ